MFNLGRLQSCLGNNVCDFLALQNMFSPLVFFFSIFFFHLDCAKHQSEDDGSVTYGRDWLQAHSYMSRHTVPLYLFIRGVSLNHFVFALSEPKYLKSERKKSPNKASIVLFYFFLLFFGASLDNPTWVRREGFPQALWQSEIQYHSHLPCR